MWSNGIVPVAMEGGGLELHCGQLGIADLDAGRIGRRVQLRPDLQSSACGSVANQVDDHLQADQRPATPILGDVAEQAVFDQVPLTGTRREVAHTDAQPGLIRQALQLGLPQRGVAATERVRRSCLRKMRLFKNETS